MTTPLTDAILRALDQAMLLDNPGDKVLMALQGSMVWRTGDNTPKTFTVSVPSSDDFYAERIGLMLQARIIDQTDLNGDGSDLTFRPAAWIGTNYTPPSSNGPPVADADATWKMEDTYNHSYQGDTALRAALAYSAQYAHGFTNDAVVLSAWPGSRQFFVPLKLKRGSTLTVSVQPTFSRVENTTTKHEYKAVALLTGYKTVRGHA